MTDAGGASHGVPTEQSTMPPVGAVSAAADRSRRGGRTGRAGGEPLVTVMRATTT